MKLINTQPNTRITNVSSYVSDADKIFSINKKPQANYSTLEPSNDHIPPETCLKNDNRTNGIKRIIVQKISLQKKKLSSIDITLKTPQDHHKNHKNSMVINLTSVNNCIKFRKIIITNKVSGHNFDKNISSADDWIEYKLSSNNDDFEKLAETQELDNNEISVAERLETLPATNTNQPTQQVDNMSVKNTCANYSIEPSNRDELPQENSDSIPEWVTENIPLDDEKQNGVDNTATPSKRATNPKRRVETHQKSLNNPTPESIVSLLNLFVSYDSMSYWNEKASVLVALNGIGATKSQANNWCNSTRFKDRWKAAEKDKKNYGYGFLYNLIKNNGGAKEYNDARENDFEYTPQTTPNAKPTPKTETEKDKEEIFKGFLERVNQFSPNDFSRKLEEATYAQYKGIEGNEYGVFVANRHIKISKKQTIYKGCLIISIFNQMGGVTGFEFIANHLNYKDGKYGKYTVAGSKKEGDAYVFRGNYRHIFCESWTAARKAHKSTGATTYGCFGVDNIEAIVKQLIKSGVEAKNIFLGHDADKKKEAWALRKKLNCKVFVPENGDWDDYSIEECHAEFEKITQKSSQTALDHQEIQEKRKKWLANVTPIFEAQDIEFINHPYFKDKKINDCFMDVKFAKTKINLDKKQYILPNDIMIPIKNFFTGERLGYQLISDKGNKRILKNTNTKNGIYGFNGFGKKIILCKDFATAYTVNKATGIRTFCCFSNDGIRTLSLELKKEKYNTRNIYLAFDNNQEEGNRTGKNIGDELAAKYRFKLFIPDDIGTNWNDLGVTTTKAKFFKNGSKQKTTPEDKAKTNIETEGVDLEKKKKKNKYDIKITNDIVGTYKILEGDIYNCLNLDQEFLDIMPERTITYFNCRFLVIKSGMKSGKTTSAKRSIKKIMLDENIKLIKKVVNAGYCVLFITPRKLLNRALAKELKLNYYEDVKNEKDRKLKEELVKRMACTPQSLVALLREFPHIKYTRIFLDETETTSPMLLSTVTKHKQATLDTLITACQRADAVLLMDAHVGAKTEKLAKILAGKNDITYIVNHYKAWTDYTATIITGTKLKPNKKGILVEKGLNYSDKVDVCLALIKRDLDRGEKLFLAITSKEECIRIKKMLARQYPHLNIEKIHSGLLSDDLKAANRLMKNPDRCIKIDVLIANSAIAIGVSFEALHFHKVYGMFSNTIKTGVPDDAVQHLARSRNLILKRWILAIDDAFAYERQAGLSKDDIIEAVYDRKHDLFHTPIPDIQAHNKNDASIIERHTVDLFATCELERIRTKSSFKVGKVRKSSFKKGILTRLDEMGIEYTNTDYNSSTIPNNKKLQWERAILKKDAKKITEVQEATGVKISYEKLDIIRKELSREGIDINDKKFRNGKLIEYTINNKHIEPVKLKEEEYKEASAKLRFNKEVPQDIVDAMSRYRIERKYNIDFDKMDANAIDCQRSLIFSNASQCCIYREMLSPTPKKMNELITLYGDALINGAGVSEAFKQDILSNKLNFKFIIKFLRYALPYFDGREFTNKSLKRSALVQFTGRKETKIKALRILNGLTLTWKKNPVSVLRMLLVNLGYSVERIERRIPDSDKKEYYFTASSIMGIDEHYTMRQKEGMNWWENIEKLIAEYQHSLPVMTLKFKGIEVTLSNYKNLEYLLNNSPYGNMPDQLVKAYQGTKNAKGTEYADNMIREEAEKWRQKQTG